MSLAAVSAPSSSTPMLTLDVVKADLLITHDKRDEDLTGLIVEATQAITEALGRPLWRGEYRELLSGPGEYSLRLSAWPIAEVQEVLECGQAVDPSEYRVIARCQSDPERLDRLYRNPPWLLSGLSGPGASEMSLDYEVAYTGGWVPPGGELPEGGQYVPGLLQRAGRLAVKEWFAAGLEIPLGVKSESDDGGSTTYQEPAHVLPPAAQRIVEMYA